MIIDTSKIKRSGQVFTPDYLVNNILDCAQYNGSVILRKHVIDNSCGDGAFLCNIVAKYCVEFLKNSSNKQELKKQLEFYIHGIEIDEEAYNNCIENLNNTIRNFGLNNCTWDILHADSMTVSKYNNSMDYVIGNPPYVRVHNLDNSYKEVKSFKFATGGMTDLYLVFFELGLKMLKNGGTLCYITPSSWINSLAGINLRQYIKIHRCLKEVIDIGHFQPFQAMTYTMITLLQKGASFNSFAYFKYNGESKEKVFVENISYSDAYINGNLFLGTKNALNNYRKIAYGSYHSYISVKNGFATLADKVFIKDEFHFNEMTIPVIKGSTGKWRKAFFPYDENGKPFTKEKIFSNSEIASYLESNKKELLKGKKEEEKPDWYLYGRTQALKDVYTYKISINSVIKDPNSIKLNEVPSGCGIYSGLYIIGTHNFDLIKSIIKTQDFVDYIALLKKYKSGGYYTFNSKDVEIYLNYKLSKSENYIEHDKQRVFESNLQLF